MKFKNIIITLTFSLATIFGGCSWLKKIDKTELEKNDYLEAPPEILVNEAEQYLQDGSYDEAIIFFQQLKDHYPYSRYALLADLRLGDAYAKAQRYEEAILAYEDFMRLHPKNEAIPYALYQIGMVYHQQMLTPDRDSTFSHKAVDIFQHLIQDYPNSDWAQQAQPQLKESLECLASHDLAIGQFYYRSKHYEAAINRFKQVLIQYPNVGCYNEAIEGIRLAQKALDLMTEDERKQRGDDRRDLLMRPPNVEMPQVIFENERRGGGF